ncbi:LysM peptidoglycan-binding domain-containing protein, partial [Streptomyces zhihengii]
MPAIGKHRRNRSRRLTRGLLMAGTGGAALVLPVIAAASASAAQPAAAKAAVTAPAPAKKAAKTYTVVAGDTLSKIAEKQSVSGGWKKLYNDNRRNIGADPSLIRPGLQLTIGAKAAPADRTADTARADRSEKRAVPAVAGKSAPAVKPAAAKTYADNLDGWIRESLDIMAKHGIPGSYEGIHRNVMRESSGNPLAINNWDINAVNGVPSKGLLQVIKPTF